MEGKGKGRKKEKQTTMNIQKLIPCALVISGGSASSARPVPSSCSSIDIDSDVGSTAASSSDDLHAESFHHTNCLLVCLFTFLLIHFPTYMDVLL